jgi:hypothetical protein
MIPKTIPEIDASLKALFALRDGLNSDIVTLNDMRKTLISNSLTDWAKDMTPEKFMGFREWNNINSDIHDKLADWFSFNYSKKGLKRNGYNAYTQQSGLNLMFDQNVPFEEQLGILDFFPFIEPSEYHGQKIKSIHVGIFEHTLSEQYSYSLQANPEKTNFTVENHCGHEYFESGNLMDTLKFIYERFPYIRGKNRKV